MKTKIQLIDDALAEIRISGLTSQPDNEDVKLALGRLESMMSELKIDLGFRFESTPNPNTPSGIPSYANYAISLMLAGRLAPLYGKAAPNAGPALSQLYNRTARPSRVAYPNRMPIGMGNRRLYGSAVSDFMPEVQRVPQTVDTEQLVVGDVKPFAINVDYLLQAGETISSFTKTADNDLLITNDSSSGTTISFTAEGQKEGYYTAVFEVTGSLGSIVNATFSVNIIDEQIVRANP